MSSETTTSTLYACVHAAEFPAQALLRLRPDLQAESVVVLEGRAPQEFVCAMNRHAHRKGAAHDMTRLDVEGLGVVRTMARSVESEVAASAVLMECAARFSPRIEDASEGTACTFVLDITGTERLFGPPTQLAERLRAALVTVGFRVSVAVSANYDAARMKAASSHGISVIREGEESRALEKLPIAALGLADEHREIFTTWAIRTLGELAALPEVELIVRLGQEAQIMRQRACGASAHMFEPIEAEFSLKEFCEFETQVEEVESLLFMGARMIDSLVARAGDRALSLALITARMKLEGGGVHECVLRPAVPSADRKFLLKLLQLEIAAHPPQAAAVALELAAEAGLSSTMQLGLFAPQMPEPSRLDVTLARLRAIVGEGRVGSPALEDSHRAGSFRMEKFVPGGKMTANQAEGSRMALRRMRPPVPVRVAMAAMKPATFREGENNFEVTAAYGPWRSSGCWWSANMWDVEEWDVLATSGNNGAIACLLVCDGARKEWRLEAFFD